MTSLNVQRLDRRFLKSGLLEFAWALAGGVFITLLAVWPLKSYAGAAECRFVFEEASRDAVGAPKRTSAGARYLQHFQGLQARMAELKSPEEKLNLVLTRNESHLMGREFRTILSEVVAIVEGNVLSSRNRENAQAGLEATKALAQEITQHIVAFEQGGSYEKALQLATTVTDIAERMEKIMRLDPNDEEGYITTLANNLRSESLISRDNWRRRLSQFVDTLKERPSLVLVPMARALTIVDLNEFAGTGIAPIGMISRSVWADGRLRSPSSFLEHDIGHALFATPEKFSETQMKQWREILAAINSHDPAEREALHAMLYLLSHERVAVRRAFINAASAGVMLNPKYQEILIERLKDENFWDLEALRNVPNLPGFIETQAKEFVRIVSAVLR